MKINKKYSYSNSLFLNRNRGKRSIVLDLSIQSNFNIFKKIVKQIDIFINSSIPNTLEKIGLSPNELLLINPKLIICRISGYGQTGKMSQQDGKDINFLATSGILSTFGPKEQLPGFPANIMVINNKSLFFSKKYFREIYK